MDAEFCIGGNKDILSCSNLRPCPKIIRTKSSCSSCRRGCVSDSAPYVDCLYDVQRYGFSEREYPMLAARKFKKKCTWRFRGKHEVHQPAHVTYKCYKRWINYDKSEDTQHFMWCKRTDYREHGGCSTISYRVDWTDRNYQCCDIDHKGTPTSLYLNSGWIGRPNCAGSKSVLEEWKVIYGSLEGWWRKQGCVDPPKSYKPTCPPDYCY